VIVKDVGGEGAARPVTEPGDYTDLAWAPTAAIDVLAMAKGPAESRELCVGEIADDKRMEPDCKGKPGLTIGRAIHWSPDGRTLLAFGKNAKKEQQGIVRWRSPTPFSSRREDWGDGKFVSDVSDPAHFVADAAISPDGNTLALIANVGSTFFQLFLTAPNDFRMNADPQPLGVRGCKVVWRSDSKQVAVAEGDATCAQGNGAIRAVPVDDPNAAQQLTQNGSNPAFQPRSLEG
jgi:hypothetical protein